jgi:hypothetical protein
MSCDWEIVSRVFGLCLTVRDLKSMIRVVQRDHAITYKFLGHSIPLADLPALHILHLIELAL